MNVQDAKCKNESSAEFRYGPMLLTNLDNAESPARPGFA